MTSPPTFSLDTLELGPMENFVYLIRDHDTGRAAVIDPAWEVPRIVELARQRSVRITDVLLTHSHHDHVNGVGELLESFDARIHLLQPEVAFWGRELERPLLHHGGDTIALGRTSIQVLHTPGHTPGSACYLIDRHLITGDTLFVFGCGRCDLRGGDPEAMYRTLKDFATNLSGETVIHPGHNYAEQLVSNIEEQREGNPFMHFESLSEFVRYRMVDHDRLRHSPYAPVPRPPRS